MIIQSSTKDYYDHQAHIYGGGDPSIRYIRKPLSPLTRRNYSNELRRESIRVKQSGIKTTGSTDHFKFKWLSVVGKYYLLYTPHELFPDYRNGIPEYKYRILTQKENAELFRAFTQRPTYGNVERQYKEGEFSDSLVELSRKVNAPVFTFDTDWRSGSVVIDPEVPNLGELGMAKIIPPDQMYQDISYFLGNIMKESPDMMPVTKMTDKEKILGHGFDFKQSFRNRV